jgi:alpha-beta hydrolase superfamily lysophospholipase
MKLAQRLVLGYYRNKLRTLALLSPARAAEEAFKLICTPYSKRRFYTPPLVFEKATSLSFKLANFELKGFKWHPTEVANGKRILICHGFDSNSYNFERYITPLLELGFEVLAFDAPAHGLSTGKTINAGEYRDTVLKINELYGPIDGIMSHSFGGLAVALAVEKLEDNQHKRLVLIAPATETTRSITSFFKYIPVSEKVRAEFDKLIERVGGNPASWFSVSRVIQQISTPTLWVHDKEDNITPFEDMQHLLAKNLQHVEFEITEGLGHSKIYRDNRITDKVVAFLSELIEKEKKK